MAVLGCLLFGGCGSSNGLKGAARVPRITMAQRTDAREEAQGDAGIYTQVDKDRDNDVLANPYDDMNNRVLDVGRPATSAEVHTITTLVGRYYLAVVNGNTLLACSMIYRPIAVSAGEDYGRSGPDYLRGGDTCPEVMSRLVVHFHKELASAYRQMNVVRIRILSKVHGISFLKIGKVEREMPIQKEGSRWTVDSLLDNELP